MLYWTNLLDSARIRENLRHLVCCGIQGLLDRHFTHQSLSDPLGRHFPHCGELGNERELLGVALDRISGRCPLGKFLEIQGLGSLFLYRVEERIDIL